MPGSDRTLYESASALRIGAFRRYPWETSFENTGPIGGFLLVFPRTSVVIQHAGRAPVVADPTRVMLYNRGQEYRRAAVSAEGDRCDWFAVAPEIARDVVRAFDPAVDDCPERPFHAPSRWAAVRYRRRAVVSVKIRPIRRIRFPNSSSRPGRMKAGRQAGL